MTDVLIGIWICLAFLRLLVLLGKIPAALYQRKLELAGLAVALVLLGAQTYWVIAIEALYQLSMYLIARLMTSPRFVAWLMRGGSLGEFWPFTY